MSNWTLKKKNPEPFVARIPGSKSYTNRALVIACMRPGTTEIVGALKSDDTMRLAKALASFGGIEVTDTDTGFKVTRSDGTITAPSEPMDMGGAGTPARFLLAFAASAEGDSIVTGNARLCERPMNDILDTLRTIGIAVECQATEGCLPAKITGGTPTSTEWTIRGDVSSQFTSSLILFASQQKKGPISIHAEGNVVSLPYIEMTLSMMRECGLKVDAKSERDYMVEPCTATADRIQVEVDASGMSYFLAAAALTGTTVRIDGIGKNSSQGDVGLARAFESMGCALELGEHAIQLTGGPLRGIDIDMEVMPDVVLTLAPVAAMAEGITRITNIANLRVKECDRIHAAAAELGKLGVTVEEGEDFLVIHPGATLKPASIHTYDDHRVAMCFAILGLVFDPIEIEDPGCVVKSFPDFWNEFDRFRQHHNG